MTTLDEAMEKAAEIGEEHGENAASWVTDGNTTEETYRALLAGIQEGDPAILDQLPSADLSGQWADGYTVRQLLADCDIEEDESGLIAIGDALADNYSLAFSEAVEHEIERVCRLQLDT